MSPFARRVVRTRTKVKLKEVHAGKWGRLGRGRGQNACLASDGDWLICESDYSSITIILYSQELPMIVPLERKNFFFT